MSKGMSVAEIEEMALDDANESLAEAREAVSNGKWQAAVEDFTAARVAHAHTALDRHMHDACQLLALCFSTRARRAAWACAAACMLLLAAAVTVSVFATGHIMWSPLSP